MSIGIDVESAPDRPGVPHIVSVYESGGRLATSRETSETLRGYLRVIGSSLRASQDAFDKTAVLDVEQRLGLFDVIKQVLDGLDGCCLDDVADAALVLQKIWEAVLGYLPEEDGRA